MVVMSIPGIGRSTAWAYARYLETREETSTARAIYRRACVTHLPTKPNAHLAWSAFEEKHGNYDEAKTILNEFEKRSPGLMLIQLRKIGVERRHAVKECTGDNEKPDYSSVTGKYERYLRDPRTPVRLASFYALKFARFHAKVRGDGKLAEKILKDALSRDKDNTQLYMQLIDYAYNAENFNERDVCEAFDRAIQSPDLADTEKLKFSQRKLEFLEDVGTDVERLQSHFESHIKLFKSVNGGSTSKRKSTADVKNEHDKRARTDGYSGGGGLYGNLVQAQAPVAQYYPQQQQAVYPQQTYNAAAASQYGSYYYPPPY